MARLTTRRGPAGLSGRVQARLADQVLVTAAQPNHSLDPVPLLLHSGSTAAFTYSARPQPPPRRHPANKAPT